MFERIRNLGWEAFLGVLAVAAVLLAIPLVRPDIDKLVHVPEFLYLAFAVAGSVLAAVGLAGVVVLLLGHVLKRPTMWCEFRPVSKRDVPAVLEIMRQFFGEETPSASRILEWQRRNKTVLTAVYAKHLESGRTTQTLVGVFKVVPLTPRAVALLEAEQITGATLRPDHIAAEGDEVGGLYIGDVVASTRQAKAEVLRQLKQRVQRQLKVAMPVYTRPLTSDGARLVRKYNFIPMMDEVLPGATGRIHKLTTTGVAGVSESPVPSNKRPPADAALLRMLLNLKGSGWGCAAEGEALTIEVGTIWPRPSSRVR